MERIEFEIRCNNLHCRRPFGNEQAVVTSCSHLFCLTCAQRDFAQAKVCPACRVRTNIDISPSRPAPTCGHTNYGKKTPVVNDSDLVMTDMNPTEDYKKSVLAGLTPDVIFDIAQRGLVFFTYQMSQELAFHSMKSSELSSKTIESQSRLNEMTVKYDNMERSFQQQLSNANSEKEQLKIKVSNLTQQLHEKSQEHLKDTKRSMKVQSQVGNAQLSQVPPQRPGTSYKPAGPWNFVPQSSNGPAPSNPPPQTFHPAQQHFQPFPVRSAHQPMHQTVPQPAQQRGYAPSSYSPAPQMHYQQQGYPIIQPRASSRNSHASVGYGGLAGARCFR
jgi:E3 ubiquitin-protein ligase CCNP1IP1